MNEYKLAWYNETNAEFNPIDKTAKPNDSPTFKQVMKEQIKDEAIDWMATSALIFFGTHMAQSQISGPLGMATRTLGRVALRAIPVIGVAWMAYSVYDWLD